MLFILYTFGGAKVEFEEGVKVLVGWGLTRNQAKVILALAELGQATAKRIAQGSTVARETVYCVLMELQELGLIEKTLSRPVLFHSIPLENILSLMCDKKAKELSDLKLHSRTFLKNFKENNVNFELGGIPSKTVFLPPKILAKETQKAIKEARESICFLLSCKKTYRLSSALPSH
jgi:sugar-specific transcriptional regulator TrmB